MLKRYIILLFLYLFAGVSYAGQYFFTNYSIEQGLSQSVVNCLFQDSRGFIWIGTQNGLNRFNGYSFESFTSNPSDVNSISNNWIYSVGEDREGNLWIGTKGGVNKFLVNEKKFQRIIYSNGYPYNVTDYAYDAIVSFNGTILINTPPVLTIFDPLRHEFRHFTSTLEYDGAVKDNRIPLIEDFEGLIWIGSSRGLAVFDRNTGHFRYYMKDHSGINSISDNNITALFEDKRGNIWIGTSNGLNVYSKATKCFTQYFNDPRNPNSLGSNFIRAITADRNGNIWIGTEEGGLSKMVHPENNQPWFENLTSDNNGLNHNIVLALKIDRSDNLWIGALQGISKTDLKRRKFRLYRHDSSPYSVNLLGNVVASIFKDEEDKIWIGNWGQGLNIYHRKTGKVDHFSSRLTGNCYLPNDFVHMIFRDLQKRIWIGTRDGILIYENEKKGFTRFRDYFKKGDLPSFKGIRINMIIADRKGNYWIGTQNGLFKMNIENGTTEVFSIESPPERRLSSNLVYSLLEDREGLIWIATLNGIDIFNPATGKMTHYQKSTDNPNSLCDNFVISLCEDHNGDIWIGTGSYVNKFIKKEKRFVYYSQENGLPSNRIFEILEDRRENLWFSSGNGLSKLDTVTGKFRNYTVDEGLQSLEFNLRASYQSADGEVFFGGMNGFNSFYPDSLYDNAFTPPIVFTSLYKSKGGNQEYLDVDQTGQIDLNYNDYNFTVEFSSLEFTNPANNRYAYKMEGISEDWIDIGNRRFVPFSNLSPGEYILHVKGSNNDGKWNETGKSLKIVIHPPWWKTTFAYVGYFLISFLIILLIIRQREKNLHRTKEILEKKVHERTEEIENQNQEIQRKNGELSNLNKELQKLNATKDKFFSIIAHDLRNPFNTILGLSDILLTDFKTFEEEKIRYYLSNIKDASGQAFELLQNLLIWARSQTGGVEFTPVEFNLKARVTENIELVESQATRKGIALLSVINDQVKVRGDVNMVNTILRNLLTNAVKFTPRGGSVEVGVNEKEHLHEIYVTDSGVGIEEQNLKKIFRIDSKHTTKGTDKEKGTGLGLILCREFVEKMGGHISVESKPGAGSTFLFTLPKQEKR
ncbi:MAG: two-component regulator propeller domain-containing protein [Bacteroidota bacterium]